MRFLDPSGLWERSSNGGVTTNDSKDIEKFLSYLQYETTVLNKGVTGDQMSKFVDGEMSSEGLGITSDGSKFLSGLNINSKERIDGKKVWSSEESSYNKIRREVQRALTPDETDPSTIGRNLLGLTYPGGNNPKKYNGKDDYSYVPQSLAEYPAIIHDKAYDKLGVKGASGLLFDLEAIPADWQFVRRELFIANLPVDAKTKRDAKILGVGLGALATPKTVAKTAILDLNPINRYLDAIFSSGY